MSHRENILLKSLSSFEKIIHGKKCGVLSGNKKQINSEFLFATVQTLSSNLEKFSKDEFDYIVVDEAHHISSPTHRKIVEYFTPKFLLGLTATPNRSDGVSIVEYFEKCHR